MAFTYSDEIQIKLLYQEYGWKPKQIAEFLEMSTTVVEMLIEERGFHPPAIDVAALPSLPPGIADAAHPSQHAQPQPFDEYAATVRDIKRHEAIKQREIMPLLTITEVLLASKLQQATALAEPEHLDQLMKLVRIFTTFTERHIASGVASEEQARLKADAAAAIAAATSSPTAITYNFKWKE